LGFVINSKDSTLFQSSWFNSQCARTWKLSFR